MKRNIETGHTKNATNFALLYGICKGMADYKPANALLALTTMEANKKLWAAQTTAVLSATNTATAAISDREVAFKELHTIGSSVKSAIESSEMDEAYKIDGLAIVAKMKGTVTKNTPKAPPTGSATAATVVTAPGTSRSSKSFSTRLLQLENLTIFLALHPDYKPNEAELTLASLQDRFTKLKAIDDTANESEADLTRTRATRDDMYYTGKGNLISTVKLVKAYVSSIYKFGSTQRKQVSELKFTPKAKQSHRAKK